MTTLPNLASAARNDDGSTTLFLTLPAGTDLDLLAEGADRAYESYSRGADTEDERLLADAVLSPLASLLAVTARDLRGLHLPDAPLTSGEAAWVAKHSS